MINNKRIILKQVCKPNSVPAEPEARWAAVIPLAQELLPGSSILPGCSTARATPPSLFGLAPCGVCQACLLLSNRCALTAPFHPYPERIAECGFSIVDCNLVVKRRKNGLSNINRQSTISNPVGAVSFLLHFPYSYRVPRVRGHTALRSSDFPPAQPVRIEPATARPAPDTL
jgi:hypothetical protein